MGGYREGTGKVEGSEVEGAGVEGFCLRSPPGGAGAACRGREVASRVTMGGFPAEIDAFILESVDVDFAGEESGRAGFRACEIDDGGGPKFLYAAENERVIEMRLGKSRIVNLYENARGAEEFGR
ncbi:hypothetical protein ROHU_032207 [Labeo rohita]|uniref:Uncharacterized protein n=1 Tax=Labeo rohita TaxID=84645 RepID=A0A498LHA8_LABRO|nr:hypothetical protein ROHU_012437 [Labeo rohita]RXN07698.1 hypothetical protein ROHU_032207 [Labeo rohita]